MSENSSGAEEGNVSPELLEEIIAQEAQRLTMEAHRYPDPVGYLDYFIQQEARKYRYSERTRAHLYDFLVDSYVFWRRHNHHTDAHECEQSEASWLAIRDTFEYLWRLKNHFPFQERGIVPDWRKGTIIKPRRHKKE